MSSQSFDQINLDLTEEQKRFNLIFEEQFKNSKYLSSSFLSNNKMLAFLIIILDRILYRFLKEEYTQAYASIPWIFFPLYFLANSKKQIFSQIINDRINIVFFIVGSLYLFIFISYINQPELILFNIHIWDSASQASFVNLNVYWKIFQRFLLTIYMSVFMYIRLDFQGLTYVAVFSLFYLDTTTILSEYANILEIINQKNMYQMLVCKIFPEKNVLITQQDDQIVIASSNIEGAHSYQNLIQYLKNVKITSQIDLPYGSKDFNQIIENMFKDTQISNQQYEFDAKQPDENTKIVEQVRILLMKFKDKSSFSILIRIDDIGKKQKYEFNQAKEQLIASLNHDVKNPIIASLSLIEKIKDDWIENQMIQIEYLNLTSLNMELCLNLVQGYLDLTQSKMGKLKAVIENFSLHEELLNIINLMNIQAKNKNIEINFIGCSKEIMCKNDRRRFIQVIMNLLSNRIKFTNKEFQNIQVDFKKFTQDNVIQISVEDFGTGIPQNIQTQIENNVETFNQENLNHHGTGVGLKICQQVVKIIGPCKKLYFKSQVGIGSKFWFYMFVDKNHQLNKKIKKGVNQFQNNDYLIQQYLETTILSKKQSNLSIKSNDHNEIIAEQQIQEVQFTSRNQKKRRSLQLRSCNQKYSNDFKINNNMNNYTTNVLKLDQNNQFSILNDDNQNNILLQNQNAEFDANNSYSSITIDKEEKLQKINQAQKFKSIQKIRLNPFHNIVSNGIPENLQFKILIVDDDELIRQVMIDFIKKFNSPIIVFQEAINGKMGLEIFKMRNELKSDINIDLIFSDIQMPELNGYEMIEQINLLNTHVTSEIIILSSNQSQVHYKRCEKFGIQKVLNKPLNYRNFKEIIESNSIYKQKQLALK